MIVWLFDRKNQHGFLPNLVKDETLQPNTPAWLDLCLKPPYSYDFTFLRYCKLDKVDQHTSLVSDYITGTQAAYYPICLNFYDPEIDYLELMDEDSYRRFCAGDFRILFYYKEGDHPEPEINDSLDRMYDKHNIDPDTVRFVTGNYKLHNKLPFIYFPDLELHYRYIQVLENQYVKEINLKPRDKKFTCLNRVDKLWRKIYCSFLFQLGCHDKGYFSYNGYKYETSHTGLQNYEDWNNYDDTLLQDTLTFEMHMPFKCDSLSDEEQNNHKLVNHDFYQNAYFNFCTETHFDSDTIFLTEKTFKPILNLQPFILVGNPGSLDLLHKLGYKTFSDVIKETYDEETDHKERMSTLLKISYDLCNLSDRHHTRIQDIIKDILIHNQQHFLSPKVNRINGLLRELEY